MTTILSAREVTTAREIRRALHACLPDDVWRFNSYPGGCDWEGYDGYGGRWLIAVDDDRREVHTYPPDEGDLRDVLAFDGRCDGTHAATLSGLPALLAELGAPYVEVRS